MHALGTNDGVEQCQKRILDCCNIQDGAHFTNSSPAFMNDVFEQYGQSIATTKSPNGEPITDKSIFCMYE